MPITAADIRREVKEKMLPLFVSCFQISWDDEKRRNSCYR